MTTSKEPLLKIEDLSVAFKQDSGSVKVVDGISLTINHGEIVAVVGESGSGKSVSAGAITRLHNEKKCFYETGRILFNGNDILNFSKKQLQDIRGNKISYVFQEPMRALNPLLKIKTQLVETLKQHCSEIEDVNKRVEELLESVGLNDTKRILSSYPHELSGGMQQRVMIAMALISSPDLIIADEPTTALDVTTQKKIIDLLLEIQKKNNISILLITHNLSLLKGVADRIYVMYAGSILEYGDTTELLSNPKHPYTKGLVNAVPKIRQSKEQQIKLTGIPGFIPSAKDYPSGCKFHTRCKHVMEKCSREEPPLKEQCRCWLYE
ncbi:MAG: ABC transporter ATP-binding protein [Kiritimatiellae bacterium]|jgi:peptide/nickel transport system ATP-binding protein|nr:ABC transporter ATP-binding protein [Kiritimatiellia bacterium]